MKPILIPKSYNYIGVFLTFDCNLGCSYCINHSGEFVPRTPMSGKDFIKGLSRISTREDLPISFSGGEPTQHPEFYSIVNALHKQGKHMDLLTNGSFNVCKFMKKVSPDVFLRNALYASIRFSYHANTDPEELLNKVFELQGQGYSVGIWGVNHPDLLLKNTIMKKNCEVLGIDFRLKEFLDENHGSYKYPEYMTGEKFKCYCKPSELLIAPDGCIFRCHRDLYANRNPYDYLLSTYIDLYDDFAYCLRPKCNPCDVKIKYDRFQVGGHTSVEIKEVL
jgi:hypothetical protein